MKRIAFLLLAIHVTMLSGCKKDGGTNGGTTKIWDINPVTVSVTATDAQGNDLLNPQTPGALEVGKIKALYKGEEYTLSLAGSYQTENAVLALEALRILLLRPEDGKKRPRDLSASLRGTRRSTKLHERIGNNHLARRLLRPDKLQQGLQVESQRRP